MDFREDGAGPVAGLPPEVGVVLVDHGSRRAAANAMLEEVARLYAEALAVGIVEAAHMELAPPSIGDALGRCVGRGARRVVVMPYFLFPGRHSAEDIPRMVRDAARAYPKLEVRVAEPLGVDPRLGGVVHARVLECLAGGAEEQLGCD